MVGAAPFNKAITYLFSKELTLGAVIFGSILLVAGIVGVLTARRSLERGTERINTLAPNSDHRTTLKIGSSFRWIFIVLCFLVGIGMIIFGSTGVLK
jgi:hypothetical protein